VVLKIRLNITSNAVLFNKYEELSENFIVNYIEKAINIKMI